MSKNTITIPLPLHSEALIASGLGQDWNRWHPESHTIHTKEEWEEWMELRLREMFQDNYMQKTLSSPLPPKW